MTYLYISGSNPFHLSLLLSQLNLRFCTRSSAAILVLVYLAPNFRGLSVHSTIAEFDTFFIMPHSTAILAGTLPESSCLLTFFTPQIPILDLRLGLKLWCVYVLPLSLSISGIPGYLFNILRCVFLLRHFSFSNFYESLLILYYYNRQFLFDRLTNIRFYSIFRQF